MSYLFRAVGVGLLVMLGLCSVACSKAAKDTGKNTSEEKPQEQAKQPDADKPISPTPQPKPKDAELIQGTWIIESILFDGKQENDRPLVIITKKKLVLQTEKHKEEMSYQLDETKQPKTIDFNDPDFPLKEGPMLGIYELNGDQLKICFSKEGKAVRPIAFESKPGSEAVLIVLKRDKNAPPVPEEKEPNTAEFPKAIVGKWKFNNGETAFIGTFVFQTEFTKNGLVLQSEDQGKTWKEKYKYRFEKDELVLILPKPVSDGKTEWRFKITSIDNESLVSRRPSGKLLRMK